MLEYAIKYGLGEQIVAIPPGIEASEVVSAPMFPVANPRNEILRALRNPIGARPLYELAKDKKNICLIISDNTRKCQYPQTLPHLLEELEKRAGKSPKEITILIASGTHREMTGAEVVELIGPAIFKKYNVVQHDGSNVEKLRRAGKTKLGTVLFYNPVAADADFIILAGSITYHYFAGFTGGRKALFPGVAAKDSIIQNHSLSIDKETGDFHERVKPGSLLGNPVHEDMLDAASELRPDFLMDVVLTPEGELAGVFAGDYTYAHRIGCQFVENHFGVLVDGERQKYSELIVAGAGGYPRDISFYQSHKALVNATNLLNPAGGTLVLIAECTEGMGHPSFDSWKPLKTSHDVSMKLRANYSALGHLVLSLRKRTETHRVILVSKLPDAEVSAWGMTPAKSVSQALGLVFSKMRPPFPPITVMPHAHLTTPITLRERVGITAKEMESAFAAGADAEIEDENGADGIDSGDGRSELAKKLFG